MAKGPFNDDFYRTFMEGFEGERRQWFDPRETENFTWRAAAAGVEEKPSSWLQATVGGFCSQASMRGYKLHLARVGGGRTVHLKYRWLSARGQSLEGEIAGRDRKWIFARVCQVLADWEPDFRLWAPAFAEVMPKDKP